MRAPTMVGRVLATVVAIAILVANHITAGKIRMIMGELNAYPFGWTAFMLSPAGPAIQALTVTTPWLLMPFPRIDRARGRLLMNIGLIAAAISAVLLNFWMQLRLP
jgi:hypothetical protein